MNHFYKAMYDFYCQTYWGNEHNSLLIPNGFTDYPNKEYNHFVKIIDNLNNKNQCSIMDICCGNGLLLKHLIEHCHSRVIPFGVDFIYASIEQASNIVHPKFSRNFFLSNAIDFEFSQFFFDFILLDPYHFTDNDLIRLLQIIVKQTSNSIVFYTYADVLRQNNFTNVADFSALRNISDLKIFNYDEVSIAVFSIIK